jgi:hypothetical protein
MTLFLMALALSIFGLAVTAIAFGAATRPVKRTEVPARPQLELVPERFFAEAQSRQAFHRQPHVPLEVLLLQIEQHVRLEQAAAESFISLPSPEALNLRTQSPLAH